MTPLLIAREALSGRPTISAGEMTGKIAKAFRCASAEARRMIDALLADGVLLRLRRQGGTRLALAEGATDETRILATLSVSAAPMENDELHVRLRATPGAGFEAAPREELVARRHSPLGVGT